MADTRERVGSEEEYGPPPVLRQVYNSRLVPEGWSIKLYCHTGPDSDYHADVYLLGEMTDDINRKVVSGPYEAKCCATGGLALTAAALRARAALA